MGDAQYTGVNVHKYFNLRQRVFLIDISEDRDRGMYESLSGTIVGRGRDSLSLQFPYSTGATNPENGACRRIFKITTETLGNGIQVAADLERVEAGTTFHLRLRSNLEMYQRFRAPRIDATTGLFQMQCPNSLDSCRDEFRRIAEQMKSHGVPDSIRLQGTAINLGVGGIRVALAAGVSPSPLSLFFLDLDDEGIPVCALADLVWSCHRGGKRECGYRFIRISKSDQARINAHIQALLKRRKIAVPPQKTNWELLDRMMYEPAYGSWGLPNPG